MSLEDPVAWLYRVAINRCHDYRRQLTRATRLFERLATRAGSEEADHGWAPEMEFASLTKKLPKQQRVAAVLFYQADLSTAEIARVMRISEGAVKSHLSRARESAAPAGGGGMMDDREIDLRLAEVFKRNAPSFEVPEFKPLPGPRACGPFLRLVAGGSCEPPLSPPGTLALAAVVGVGVWQAAAHIGGRGPIVVITDQTTTSASGTSESAALVADGQWELRVDREARPGDAKAKTELAPGERIRTRYSSRLLSGWRSPAEAPRSLSKEMGAPTGSRARGLRTAGGRVWYETDAPWGGRFVIWQTADGLQAEETAYGDGHPILHSYRGELVKAETGAGSFDYIWHSSVAAVNALGPASVTIVETKNDQAGDGDSGTTGAADGPIVTNVFQVFDPPTGRAYQRMESLVEAETLVDGAERLTIVLNNALSSIPPVSRYRYIALQPPIGLPLPLYAGSATGEQGYEALLTAIDPVGTTSAKQVEELAGGRKRLTWEREGERWKASFSLTLAANLLPDVIVIDGEVNGEEGRTEYTKRIQFQFDTTLTPQDLLFRHARAEEPGRSRCGRDHLRASPGESHERVRRLGRVLAGTSTGRVAAHNSRAPHPPGKHAARGLLRLAHLRASDSGGIPGEHSGGGEAARGRDSDCLSQQRRRIGSAQTDGLGARGQSPVSRRPSTPDPLSVWRAASLPSTSSCRMPSSISRGRARSTSKRFWMPSPNCLRSRFGPDGKPASVGKPDDWFNAAHSRYFQLYMKHYGMSSVGYSDIYVFEARGSHPGMVRIRRQGSAAGHRQTGGRSLARLHDVSDHAAHQERPRSQSKPGFDGTPGDEEARLREWVRAFNELKASAATKVAQRDDHVPRLSGLAGHLRRAEERRRRRLGGPASRSCQRAAGSRQSGDGRLGRTSLAYVVRSECGDA